jgi:hypothetical protein
VILEFIKTNDNKLIPATDECYEKISKVGAGASLFFEWKPKRNYENHKRFFSMLKLVFDNQSFYKDMDNILEIIKFRSGYFDTIITHKGGAKHYKTKSISFETMDEEQFKMFFSKAIDIALELIPMDKKELEDMILRYA